MESGSPPPESPRLRRAAESILENEALTANLDDDAAAVLLDWGVTLAKRIAASAAGLDDAAFEEATYPRMRALRKMLRYINRWAPAPDSRGLEKIITQAETTYGPGYAAPGAGAREQFLAQINTGGRTPVRAITQLRRLLEVNTNL